ncbi:hypothetical protein [Caballeronia sp. J97]|uniref:hypothetical protein n=1 Tax=Caballeronia sp. J97 TaxID=2805429 RepID=UPI002AAFD550|nr:hypothetical protein [Caballeronia sp. J97]
MRLAHAVLLLCALCLGAAAPALADKHEQTILEYGAQCAREIGEIPPFDCASGTEIPITVDGKRVAADAFPSRCDRPSLLRPDKDLIQQCMPGARILDLSRGATQISAYCRRNTQVAHASTYFDEVVVVLHHTGNGKTCWFQSKPPARDGGFDASRVPPPHEKTPPGEKRAAVEFWKTPGEVARQSTSCIACHDAGPFVLSPFIGQVWDKVPTDPWGKYSSIGPAFQMHRLKTMSTPGNTCVGCHRIGTEKSCEHYLGFSAGTHAPGNNKLADTYPMSHWMPTDNNMSEAQWMAANQASLDALRRCCEHPETPGCTFTPIPTSDAAR